MTEGQQVRQVRVEGIYDRKCEKYSNRCAICLADVRIYDLQHNRLEWSKDHTWVQEAWALRTLKLKQGDKLCFRATARTFSTSGASSTVIPLPLAALWTFFGRPSFFVLLADDVGVAPAITQPHSSCRWERAWIRVLRNAAKASEQHCHEFPAVD